MPIWLLSYPATIFSEKYRRIGSIDQGIFEEVCGQYQHHHVRARQYSQSGFKGIQIIMFSRVAYVGCSTSADKNTI